MVFGRPKMLKWFCSGNCFVCCQGSREYITDLFSKHFKCLDSVTSMRSIYRIEIHSSKFRKLILAIWWWQLTFAIVYTRAMFALNLGMHNGCAKSFNRPVCLGAFSTLFCHTDFNPFHAGAKMFAFFRLTWLRISIGSQRIFPIALCTYQAHRAHATTPYK